MCGIVLEIEETALMYEREIERYRQPKNLKSSGADASLQSAFVSPLQGTEGRLLLLPFWSVSRKKQMDETRHRRQ